MWELAARRGPQGRATQPRAEACCPVLVRGCVRVQPDASSKKLESAEARAERLAAEAELAAALEEEGDDEF